MMKASEDVFERFSFLPLAAKLHRNPYLRAIRHSFFTLMPFLLAVYFLDILNSLLLDPWSLIMGEDGLNLGFWLTGGLSGDAYRQHGLVKALASCRHVVGIGYGLISILLALLFARNLALLWDADERMTSFCAVAAFLFFLPPATELETDFVDYFSGRSFLTAFLTAFLSARLFSWLSHWKRIQFSLPDFLPPSLTRYLSLMFPVGMTILFLAIFSVVFWGAWTLAEGWIRDGVPIWIFQHPLVALLYQFLVWLLWWFGIPGYGVTSFFQQLAYVPAQMGNQSGDTAYVFTSGFFEAGLLHVLGLAIAVLVFSHHESWRSITKFSLPPLLFNLQEPLMFCMPVVLNPMFLIPYLLAPLANTVIGWIAISWGIVPVFKTGVTWTMPLLLSGSLGTDSFMGGTLQVVWLVMDIFIYAPFVITANMLEFQNEEEDGEEA